MSKGFQELWMESGTQATAVANSTAEASLLVGIDGDTPIIPANYFERLGKSLDIKLWGQMGNVVTTPGTLNITAYLDAVKVFDSGAMPLNIVAKAALVWGLELELFATARGKTTGALKGVGAFDSYSFIGAPAVTAGGAGRCMLPYNAAPAAGTLFDSTAAHLLDIRAQFSVASTSNTIRFEAGKIKLWN